MQKTPQTKHLQGLSVTMVDAESLELPTYAL